MNPKPLPQTDEFARGRAGELLIAQLLKKFGWFVVPSYDYSGKGDDKAPRMAGARLVLVLPDLDVCRDGQRKWIEVKVKERASLHLRSNTLEHGINYRLWTQYKQVAKESGAAVALVIVQEDVGEVLGALLSDLEPVARVYAGDKMGRDGMVFFPRDAFEFTARFVVGDDGSYRLVE